MRSARVIRTILGLGMGVALFASTAQAQPEDKRTYFTFSGPVALPGVTLPAGRYLFRIVDTTTSRKVIQVLSDDQKRPYTMANTINDTRRDPVKDATVSFYETPRGAPAAVKSWWYPGESIGYQFIYPRAQAKQIAKSTGQPVLTTKAESTKTEETKTGQLTRIDANGREIEVNPPDAAAQSASASNSNNGFRDQSANSTVFNRSTPAITEGVNRTPPQEAQSNSTPPPASGSSQSQFNNRNNNAPSTTRSELPQTASNLPFVGLIGMLSALGFVTLRVGRSMLG